MTNRLPVSPDVSVESAGVEALRFQVLGTGPLEMFRADDEENNNNNNGDSFEVKLTSRTTGLVYSVCP